MSKTYELNWSSSDKNPIIVEQLVLDTASTSLNLYGHLALDYGEGYQENFLRLLEHFCSDIAPTSPTNGQLWYNRSDKQFRIFDGVTWVAPSSQVYTDTSPPTNPNENLIWYDPSSATLYVWDGSMWGVAYPISVSVEPTKVAFVDEYNSLITKYNAIVGNAVGSTYTTAFGYGQQTLPPVTISDITNQKWINFQAKAWKLVQHLGLSNATPSSDGVLCLMHMDSTVVDTVGGSSIKASNPAYDTASKYGTASLKFDGTGLTRIDISNFNFVRGNRDLTIELSVYFTSIPSTGYSGILSSAPSISGSGICLRMHNGTRHLNLYVGSLVDNDLLVGTSQLTTNQWHNLIIQKHDTTLELFLNGVSQGSITCSRVLDQHLMSLGFGTNDSTSDQLLGLIDELRITGRRLYGITPITIRTAAFSDTNSPIICDVGDSGFIVNSTAIEKGISRLSANYNELYAAINSAYTNTRRFIAEPDHLVITTPASGVGTRAAAWTGTLTQEITATFSTADTCQTFFNSGGSIALKYTLTGGTTSRDTAVATFLASTVGTIKFTALNASNGVVNGPNGFYDLALGTYKQLFTVSSGASSMTVLARLETNNTVIRFKISITDNTGGSANVGGITASSVILSAANPALIDTPTIQGPAIAASSFLIGMTASITPNPANASVTGNATAAVTLTANASNGIGPYTYVWTAPVGMNYNSLTNQSMSVSKALSAGASANGSATVTVTDSLGSQATASCAVTLSSSAILPGGAGTIQTGSPTVCNAGTGTCTVTTRFINVINYGSYTAGSSTFSNYTITTNFTLAPGISNPPDVPHSDTIYLSGEGWLDPNNFYQDWTSSGRAGTYTASITMMRTAYTAEGPVFTSMGGYSITQTHT